MRYFAFPWEQIGFLLRKLSLAGAAGNIVAWILFVVIGGCPLILWGLLVRQKKSNRVDLLLAVLSLTLFSGLWFLINPSYLEAYLFPAGMGEMGKCAFATPEIGFTEGRSLGLSRCFLVIQTLCRYLPELLELGLCGVAIRFLHSCEQNSFNEDSLKQVKRLKKLSACSLGAVLGTNVCVNLLQLVFARYIYSSSFTLAFPIKHVIFMLGVLMLSRFWLESKKLKDDNTLFI